MADDLPETLKPFLERATEAQERLAKLEAALASTKIDNPDPKLDEETSEIKSKLKEANETVKQEQDKVKELTIENEKQRYRILHLVRELKAADEKCKAREYVLLSIQDGYTIVFIQVHMKPSTNLISKLKLYTQPNIYKPKTFP